MGAAASSPSAAAAENAAIQAAFTQAFLQLAAALAFKMGMLNLMTVRARLIKNDFSREARGGKPWSEDEAVPGCVELPAALHAMPHMCNARTPRKSVSVCYEHARSKSRHCNRWQTTMIAVSLGAFGPTFAVERFRGAVANANENEPYFLALVGAIAIAGNPPAWGAQAIYNYGACRFLHLAIFMLDFPSFLMPFKTLIRATPYLVSVFTMFALAADALHMM